MDYKSVNDGCYFEQKHRINRNIKNIKTLGERFE